jgi:hypothetical protein
MIDLEREATLSRLQNETHQVVLALEDTTSFNFAHHPATEGLGVIEDNRTAGFFAHTTLAASEEGVPIGLFDQQVWTRQKQSARVKDAHKKRPITEKESMKWLNGLYETQASPVTVIVVGDREADIYELYQEAQTTETSYIIRVVRNRRLEDERLLKEALADCEFVTQFEVEVARQARQEKRTAEVSLRYTSLTLMPPKRPKQAEVIPLTPLTVQVVEVLEQNPPPGVEPIHWILITNLPIESVADAQQIVRFYSYRWLVERFHYVLKSGCRMEESQLKSYEALTRFLALCSHQAWRILELTYQARMTPDAPCDRFLTPEQWQALHVYQTKTPTPNAVCPTLEEAVRGIAKLGGFIGRKSDGQPGVKVLWRGWQRLQDLAAIWEILHPPKDVGNV